MKQEKRTEKKPKKPQQFLRKEYNFLDTGKMYLNVLLYPLIVSFFFLFIVNFIAIFSGHTLEDASNTWIYIFFTMILTQATFFLIFFLYNKKNKIDVWKAAKIGKTINPWAVVIVITMAVASIFLLSPIINLLNHALSLIGYSPEGSLPFAITNFWKFLYAVITMALIPSIVEELLMRGVVFQGCLKKWKPKTAIIMGAVFFMLMHTSLQQTLYQFIMGIILCYTMYVGGNIIYPMIFHFINNLCVILATYIGTIQGTVSNTISYTTAMDYISPILYLLLAGVVLVGLSILFKKVMDKNKREREIKTAEVRPEMIAMINEGVNKNTVEVLVEQKSRRERSEKIFFWCSIAVGCLLWLVNTVYEFLNVV